MNIMQVKDWVLQRMMELAVDKMYNRGYDPTAVSKVKNEIRLYSADMVRSDKIIETLKADSLENVVEDIIDYSIDDPKYAYDESYELPLGEQRALPTSYADKAIPPGSRVSINGLKEWIVTKKVNEDSALQEAMSADFLNINRDNEWVSMLDRVVDETAFRVARKIYYVGRKPESMTPEEWDLFIVGKKPVPGSYSRNESWSGREFPYGNHYTYRQGPVDDTFLGGTTDPIFKGWTKAGSE